MKRYFETNWLKIILCGLKKVKLVLREARIALGLIQCDDILK